MLEKKTLYEHIPHPHFARNVNRLAKKEQQSANFNQKIAVGMTKLFSAMPTFWLILAWIALWIVINSRVAHFDPLPFPLLLALASIPQLPLMIVIMVGQSVLARHQELQAEEQFATSQHSFHDIEQIVQHLDRQDQELLKQDDVLSKQNDMMLQILSRLEQLPPPLTIKKTGATK